MPTTLYYLAISAPCRSVEFTAAQLGIPLEIKVVDLAAGEQMKPDFLKLNPQHAIPVLDDNGFVITESRAILGYLANSYGKDDSLYPKDPKKRAIVDQRLHFDGLTLYHRFGEAYYPAVFFGGSKIIPEDKQKALQEALGYLEGFLTKSKFVAGNSETIADHALLSSVLTFQACGVALDSFPKILGWLDEMKTRKGFNKNQEGADALGLFARNVLSK